MLYWCQSCEKIREMTQDGNCPDPGCILEGLVEYTGQDREVREAAPSETQSTVGVIGGLCLLVCDASFSMDEQAFPTDPNEDVKKLKMVTEAVDQAIDELTLISMPEAAFVGVIAFGAKAALITDEQGRPFLIAVSEIKKHFGRGLGKYLFDCFHDDRPNVNRQHTDITAALKLASDIYDGAVAGDLSRFDNSKTTRLIDQEKIYRPDKDPIQVPNVRVMLYSDGQHNPQQSSPISNPFEKLEVSPLMTAFIGNEASSKESLEGAKQLKELANICPIHGKKGYFLINSSKRHAVLRNLFRMATRASGFCQECLKSMINSGKETRPHG
jgi:hypothetical protein